MDTALIGIAGIALGAWAGYAFRAAEFRRDRRVVTYGDLIGHFLELCRSSADLQSIYMQAGESMFTDQGNSEAARPVWTEYASASTAFDFTRGRLRLIASDKALQAAAVLEQYVDLNVRNPQPRMGRPDMSTWGPEAKHGPAAVREGALPLAEAFAVSMRSDVGVRKGIRVRLGRS